MVRIDLCMLVEFWSVPGSRDNRNTASAVCSSAAEVVILVFVQIVIHQQHNGVCIFRQHGDRSIKDILETQLTTKDAVGRRPRSYPRRVSIGGGEANILLLW